MSDILSPSASLLAKLGSIVVHVQEGLSDDGHEFDIEAAKSVANDREVKDWIQGMRLMALVPVTRHPPKGVQEHE